MAVGDYEKLRRARSASWKRLRLSAWGSREHEERERDHEELKKRGETYLRDLLARLPFRWHVCADASTDASPSHETLGDLDVRERCRQPVVLDTREAPELCTLTRQSVSWLTS